MRLALPLLAAFGLAAVACGGADDSSDGSLQIDPVNGCVSGGDCKRSTDDGSSSDKETTAAPAPPTSDAPPEDTTPTTTVAAAKADNTCKTAHDMGEIPGEHIIEGDAGHPKTIKGTCDSWVKIRVKETSSFWNDLGADAKLTSSPKQKFDLYAYVDIGADDQSCTTPYAHSGTTLSQVDDVPITWSDSFWKSDNSRTVTYEVKSHDGKCAAGSSWSLTVNNYADPPPQYNGVR